MISEESISLKFRGSLKLRDTGPMGRLIFYGTERWEKNLSCGTYSKSLTTDVDSKDQCPSK
jgi:hypothetical protein